MIRLHVSAAVVIALLQAGLAAQTGAQAPQSPPGQTPPAAPAAAQPVEGTDPVTTLANETLPAGARLYVAPMPNGFDTYVVAGLQQKKVPVVVVAIREKADYELTGVSETDKAGWAKMLFFGNDNTNETASVKIVNLKTGNVVFAYSVKKGSSLRGKQSAGESVAKHIKQKIENARNE
jgi:hypothetical protein